MAKAVSKHQRMGIQGEVAHGQHKSAAAVFVNFLLVRSDLGYYTTMLRMYLSQILHEKSLIKCPYASSTG